MPRFSAPDGTVLHYRDEGEGLPVLALAGLTRNGSDFDYVAPHLQEVRLIRLDYRGRGQSDWADPSTYKVPVEGQDALALLDHLGLASAAILGTSRGGIIGMGLAAHAADRVLGLALNDIGPEIAPEGLDVIRGYVGLNPVEKTHAEAVAMRSKLLKGFEGVPTERWESEVRKNYRETSHGLEINYDPRLRESVLADAGDLAPNLWPLFDSIGEMPLALIRGANSDLITRETAAEMRRRRPDLVFAEVPGRGHVPFLDEPEAVRALDTWLGLVRQRSAA
jgi:pimeloyl-ACP methyl ester carboxylesterase